MCKYCNSENKEAFAFVYDISGNNYRVCMNKDGTLETDNPDIFSSLVQFNYCPMCGHLVNAVKAKTYREIIEREG